MAFTNFPNGITSMGVPAVGNSIPTTNGNYYFVSSVTGSNGNDGSSMETPYATLAYVVDNKVRANKGDVIVVLPGHTETISSATGMVMDTAGFSVVGLGEGGLRPTFTLGTANTATIAVSAANISISNCIFVANFLSIAACFTLTTAANFTLTNCRFRETSNILNFLNIIKSTGAANTVDGLTVIGNKWNGLGTTSVNTFILTANDINRLTVLGNQVVNATTVNAASLVIVTAGILTNADVGYNQTYRNNTTSTASLISVGGTTSTGLVYNNYTQTLDTGTNVLFATTVGLAAFNNYITGVKGASGFLIPTADS